MYEYVHRMYRRINITYKETITESFYVRTIQNFIFSKARQFLLAKWRTIPQKNSRRRPVIHKVSYGIKLSTLVGFNLINIVYFTDF